jgi:hypothetical protein
MAGQRTVKTFQASTDVAANYDDLLHRRQSQRRIRAGALAAAAVVAVLAVLSVQANLAADPQPQPMQPAPGLNIGDVPVWYDDAGLHRGDVVEQTPVELRRLDGQDTEEGALALVRTGAVYLDPATGDVWFHPWGGDPRIVGHNSTQGPGGDLNGDTAAWFEASAPGSVELVVYDTAASSEISRTLQSAGVGDDCCEHRSAGNGFKEVSAERVVWTSGDKTYSHDVPTGVTSVVELEDVADNVELRGDWFERHPDLEGFGRLSTSGNYVLAVELTKERHGAVIVDIRTDELWRVPRDVYPWIAWSYGDIAMVAHTRDDLLACDAARRTCETLPAKPPFLMPTN